MEKPSALSLPENSCFQLKVFLIPTQWDPNAYDTQRCGAGVSPALRKVQPQNPTSKKLTRYIK